MSAFVGVARRRHPAIGVRLLGPVAAIPLIFALMAVGATAADRVATAVRVSAADAARSGSLIAIRRQPVGGVSLLEIVSPGAEVLLAVSSDGDQAALADGAGQLAGSLTLARADGSQLRLSLPGLLGSGFAADGSWLAVVDGRGALWRVDAVTGEAALIGDGPFLGSPIVAADGSLLLLSVASVEAPFRSRLVRVSASSGAVTPITNDDLDYAGFPLADGGIAVVSHEPGRTLVRRVAADGAELIAQLDPGAANVAVAADGRVAYELSGRGVFLLDHPGASPRRHGAGSHPCFAPDGSVVLARRAFGTAALALDGSVLAETQVRAGLAGAVGCLP